MTASSPSTGAETASPLSPITYPARPVNGGPFPKAPKKFGTWHYEPKYNGWRTLLHLPSGTMFNRHGERLSIQSEFTTAIAQLRKAFSVGGHVHEPFHWLDCEALERRHNIGRGSLILLDAPLCGRTYKDRRTFLEFAMMFHWEDLPLFKELNKPLPNNRAFLTMTYKAAGASQLWDLLQQFNKALGCEFYEGFVAKREDSIYPLQFRSDKEEFPFWVKHRWSF